MDFPAEVRKRGPSELANWSKWQIPLFQVDWLDCQLHGPIHDELQDRFFMIVDAKQKHTVITARQYPRMMLLESGVKNGVLTISDPDGNSIKVDLKEVVKKRDIIRSKWVFIISTTNDIFSVFHEQKEEGLDCGDEVSRFFNHYLNVEEKREIRLLYFIEGLYTERNVVTQSNFWNNPVPKLTDYVSPIKRRKFGPIWVFLTP